MRLAPSNKLAAERGRGRRSMVTIMAREISRKARWLVVKTS